MEADAVQAEIEIAKSENAGHDNDKDETSCGTVKEPEYNRNQENGVMEEKTMNRNGELDEKATVSRESNIPVRENTNEDDEGSERKEPEAEKDDNETEAGTSMSDTKTHKLDENDTCIAIGELKEGNENKDVEETLDEMDGDAVIYDQTDLEKTETEDVITDEKMTETLKNDEAEIDKEVEEYIDKDIQANVDGDVEHEINSEEMVTGREDLVDIETSTDTKYADNVR